MANDLDISEDGLRMLQGFEGTVLHQYVDQAGVSTVCTGHVVRPDDASWIADGVTREECAEVLRKDVARYVRCVNQYVTVAVTQDQFDALTSLCFNIGETAFRTSTLVRVLNSGDYVGAAMHFVDWRFAGGQPILLQRRMHEAAMFSRGIQIDQAKLQAAVEAAYHLSVDSTIDPMGSSQSA